MEFPSGRSDLLKFEIPALFIKERVRLTPAELSYGYEHGWLTDADSVSLAIDIASQAQQTAAIVERLSFLLSDEMGLVHDLMDDLRRRVTYVDNSGNVWVYLALAWIHENRNEFDDPFQAIEMLYADFEYPDFMEPFIRFMPPPEGATAGIDGLEERWEAYLRDADERYQKRIDP